MFQEALSIVLKLEGGYADHPKDPGGPTNFGITHSTYHRYLAAKKRPLRPVKDITKDEVAEIYERGYWDAANCNLIDDTHPHTAVVLFDAAVNCGTVTAVRMLQDVLGVKIDGMFGKVTLATVKKADDKTLAEYLLARRLLYYKRLVERKPSLKIFGLSWAHRLNHIARVRQLTWQTCDVR